MNIKVCGSGLVVLNLGAMSEMLAGFMQGV